MALLYKNKHVLNNCYCDLFMLHILCHFSVRNDVYAKFNLYMYVHQNHTVVKFHSPNVPSGGGGCYGCKMRNELNYKAQAGGYVTHLSVWRIGWSVGCKAPNSMKSVLGDTMYL